ncbi:unnamed protein product, partial [marine sediment metagenome]
MVKVCVLTIFRDEAHVIFEWAKHYIMQGFDHLYMINNNSSDDYQSQLDLLSTDKITIYHEIGDRIQIEALQKYYNLIRNKYDWILICDLDEFLYLNNQDWTIKSFLDKIPIIIESVTVYWKIFIPSSFFQPKSVIENNTIVDRNAKNPLYKSIIRTTILPYQIHHHIPKINRNKIMIFFPNDNIIQLNHYRYQSWEFTLGVKFQRGGGHQGNKRWKKLNKFRMSLDPEKHYIDDELKSRSQSIIDNVNEKIQIHPNTSIYNNHVYHRIKKNKKLC